MRAITYSGNFYLYDGKRYGQQHYALVFLPAEIYHLIYKRMDNNIVRWYSVVSLTEYLGASRDTIMKWITTNEILSAKLDGCGNSRLAKWPLTMKSGAAADR